MGGDGLALGQGPHIGVVAMDPLAGEHMRLEEVEDRSGDVAGGADLIGHGGQAEGDAFLGVAVGLAP